MEKIENLRKLFYYLRADEYGLCNILIKGKQVKLGDGDGMQVHMYIELRWFKEVFMYFAEDIRVSETKLHISKST